MCARTEGDGPVWYPRSCLTAVATLALCLLGAAAAQAQVPADARAVEARQECLAGRYQRGIDLLAVLFTETRDPNYIFNQARCYQQNNRPDEAISRFREYLRTAHDLAPADRADVQRHIDDCETMKADVGGAKRPTDPHVEQRSERLEQDAERGARRLRVAGISIAAAGAGALVFGAVMSYRTSTLESDFQQRHRDTMGTFFDQKAYNSGQRAELFQWIGYAVGAVAVGTGGIFYYLGQRDRESPRSVALAPYFSVRGAGANLSWRF